LGNCGSEQVGKCTFVSRGENLDAWLREVYVFRLVRPSSEHMFSFRNGRKRATAAAKPKAISECAWLLAEILASESA